MATEISFLEIQSREPTLEELECFFDDVIPLPTGFRTAVLRKSDSDPRKVVGFSTWASIEAHNQFIHSPRSTIVDSSISQLGLCPLYSFHVYFEQGLPHGVFHCPFSELIILKRRHDTLPNQLKCSLDTYLKLASSNGLRSYYYGFEYEDPTFFVILLGWDSVEAQTSMMCFSFLTQMWNETNRLTIDDSWAVRHAISMGEWGAFREMELQVKRRLKLIE